MRPNSNVSKIGRANPVRRLTEFPLRKSDRWPEPVCAARNIVPLARYHANDLASELPRRGKVSQRG